MSGSLSESWYSGFLPYGHVPTGHLRPIGRPTSIERNESRSPRARNRSIINHSTRSRQDYDTHETFGSLAASPGTRIYPRPAHSPITYTEPPIPFVAAARQLNRTIRCAITFFDNFHLIFRESSDGLRFHVNKDLLNKIWQSQLHASRTSPTHDWCNRKSKIDDQKDQQNNYQSNQDYMNNTNRNANSDNDSHSTSPNAEVLSFHEYQQQVVSRVQALISSKPPIILAAAVHCVIDNSSSSSPRPQSPSWSSEQDHDEELVDARTRQHAAATLRKKMGHCWDDLKEAVEAMGRDHVFAKQAIREMKVVKQQLITYSQAWDERWEDNGGGTVMKMTGGW